MNGTGLNKEQLHPSEFIKVRASLSEAQAIVDH